MILKVDKGPFILTRENKLGSTFCDYQFWVSPNGDIVLDPAIVTDNADKYFNVGSKYVLTKTNDGNLVFVKLEKPYAIVPYPPMDTDTEWPRR